MANETVFRRYEHNPIVTPAAVPTANSIFNSAVVPFGTGFAGVFRVDSVRMEAGLHAGFSDDGLAWQIEAAPKSVAIRMPSQMRWPGSMRMRKGFRWPRPRHTRKRRR